MKTSGEVEVKDDHGDLSMFFIGFPVQIVGYGELVGRIKFEGDREVEFIRMPVLEPNKSPKPSAE